MNITIRISQMSLEKSNFLMIFSKNLERFNIVLYELSIEF